MITINILSIDQARHSGWALYDYGQKQLLEYGAFGYPSTKYTYERSIYEIQQYVKSLIIKKQASAIFIEDIQLRRNIDSFKKLARLQGALISMLEDGEYLYDLIAPSSWQGYCNARGRTDKELKAKIQKVEQKPKSKQLSIQFVKDQFGLTTENDNIADAICMGWYAVNNIKIKKSEE